MGNIRKPSIDHYRPFAPFQPGHPNRDHGKEYRQRRRDRMRTLTGKAWPASELLPPREDGHDQEAKPRSRPDDAYQDDDDKDPTGYAGPATVLTGLPRTIRRHELRLIVPLADSTIYEMEKRGDFPRRFNLTLRCVVWDLEEV